MGASALWAQGPGCWWLGEELTLVSSHLPLSCLLSTSPPSPQLQPGGGSGTLNLGPHQSAQRKNFGLLPLAAVTRKAWHRDPDTVSTACRGQRVRGRRGWGGVGEQSQWASGTTWAGDWPLWDRSQVARGFRPAQTCPCLQLRSHLNVTHSSPETVSKNLAAERALVFAQSGTFTVANHLLTKVCSSLPLDLESKDHPTVSPTFFLVNSPLV